MKRVLLLATCLVGCSKGVRVTATDYTTREFTVCGTQFANKKDLNEEAAKQQCKGPPKVLRCGQRPYGTNTYYGGPESGICCDYVCP